MEATMAPNSEADEYSGLNQVETEKYLARTLFDDKHYAKIHQALASRWDRLHSLSAAMALMERYGVKLTKEEEQRLANLDESQQINALVMKMPQQSNEQFQQFFLQLQLLVSTATRVRQALEQGRPCQVEEALNDADSTGISQYILRMAIVQAGTEVAVLKQQYQAWLKETNGRCSKLIRGQEDAMQMQKKLASAHAQLSLQQAEQSGKVKGLMMNFASQSSKGLLAAVYKSWSTHTRHAKMEREVAGELQDKLDLAVMRLAEYKEKSLGQARGMLMKKAMAGDEEKKVTLFRTWRDEVKEAREKEAMAGEVQALEAKIQGMKSASTDNAKKVMLRMNGSSDFALVGMVFQAFVTFHEDYQKNKEMEDRVKLSEQQFASMKAKQSESAQKAFATLGGATDSGLIKLCYQGWKDLFIEAKQEAELEAKLHNESSKMSSFASRSKDSGMNVMERARYHLEQGFLLRLFNAWKLDTRMEMTLKTYHAKIDAKRGQLVGVQHMFRRFAGELESSFKRSQDSHRELKDGPPAGRRLQKSDGTVSLPDINQKQSSGRPKEIASGRGRTPVGSAYPSSRSGQVPTSQPRGAWH